MLFFFLVKMTRCYKIERTPLCTQVFFSRPFYKLKKLLSHPMIDQYKMNCLVANEIRIQSGWLFKMCIRSFTLCFHIYVFRLSTFNIQILNQKELKTNIIHKKIMSYRCSQFSSSNLNFMLPLFHVTTKNHSHCKTWT